MDCLSKQGQREPVRSVVGFAQALATLQAGFEAVAELPQEADVSWWGAEFADACASLAEGRLGVAIASGLQNASVNLPRELRPVDFADFLLRFFEGINQSLANTDSPAWVGQIVEALEGRDDYLSIDQVVFILALTLLYPGEGFSGAGELVAACLTQGLAQIYSDDIRADTLPADPVAHRFAKSSLSDSVDLFEISVSWSDVSPAALYKTRQRIDGFGGQAAWSSPQVRLGESVMRSAVWHSSALVPFDVQSLDVTIRHLQKPHSDQPGSNVIALRPGCDKQLRMAFVACLEAPGIAQQIASAGATVVLNVASSHALIRAEKSAFARGADALTYLCGSVRAREFAAQRAKLDERVQVAPLRNDLDVLSFMELGGPWRARSMSDLVAVIRDAVRALPPSYSTDELGEVEIDSSRPLRLLAASKDGPIEIANYEALLGAPLQIIYGGQAGISLIGEAL